MKRLNGAKRLAMAIVETAPSEEGPWKQVRAEDLPDWVKDPDNMANMLQGLICRNEREGVLGQWYRARRV